LNNNLEYVKSVDEFVAQLIEAVPEPVEEEEFEEVEKLPF
jgi:hypothetical protein